LIDQIWPVSSSGINAPLIINQTNPYSQLKTFILFNLFREANINVNVNDIIWFIIIKGALIPGGGTGQIWSIKPILLFYYSLFRILSHLDRKFNKSVENVNLQVIIIIIEKKKNRRKEKQLRIRPRLVNNKEKLTRLRNNKMKKYLNLTLSKNI